MAYLSTRKRKEGKLPRMRIDEERRHQKQIDAKNYEIRRVRHESEEWQHLAEEEGMELINLRKTLADEKRHRLYERIGWLLLSTSLALAPHL